MLSVIDPPPSSWVTTQPLLNPAAGAPLRPPTKDRSTTIAAVATRRTSIISTVFLLYNQPKTTNSFEFRMTVPDQTPEEAESEIGFNAQSLVKVKDLLIAESWKEAQKSLRKSSALLKQDIYTMIQSKPPEQRPGLRKAYSDLFGEVARLDYAARDKDKVRVWGSYNHIVSSLNFILSQLINK